jgi:hypothetical protein
MVENAMDTGTFSLPQTVDPRRVMCLSFYFVNSISFVYSYGVYEKEEAYN